MHVALALNMDNFSEKYKIFSGNEWAIHIKKIKPKNRK
jgi:S-adenosylmethionine hydrolase